MTAIKKYKAYTLIEMLIVMSIFIVIGAIGFSTFYGMRDSLSMNEDILNLQQDLRYAQRAALFLERSPSERWIYGIGIDFTTFSANKEYKMFKWCSPFTDFGDARTRSALPHFDISQPVSQLNANLPVNVYSGNDCSSGLNISEKVKIDKFGLTSVNENFTVTLPNSNGSAGDVGDMPAYVLFESVSGRAFFYDNLGRIVNYAANGSLIAQPKDFEIYIESPRTKVRKIVRIGNISGKLYVSTQNL